MWIKLLKPHLLVPVFLSLPEVVLGEFRSTVCHCSVLYTTVADSPKTTFRRKSENYFRSNFGSIQTLIIRFGDLWAFLTSLCYKICLLPTFICRHLPLNLSSYVCAKLLSRNRSKIIWLKVTTIMTLVTGALVLISI